MCGVSVLFRIRHHARQGVKQHVDGVADERNRAEEEASSEFDDEADDVDSGDERQLSTAGRPPVPDLSTISSILLVDN